MMKRTLEEYRDVRPGDLRAMSWGSVVDYVSDACADIATLSAEIKELRQELLERHNEQLRLHAALESKDRLIAELVEALDECEDYFDNKADADHDETGFVPNKEMILSHLVKTALEKAGKHQSSLT